jgi:hypothetical protein
MEFKNLFILNAVTMSSFMLISSVGGELIKRDYYRSGHFGMRLLMFRYFAPILSKGLLHQYHANEGDLLLHNLVVF